MSDDRDDAIATAAVATEGKLRMGAGRQGWPLAGTGISTAAGVR